MPMRILERDFTSVGSDAEIDGFVLGLVEFFPSAHSLSEKEGIWDGESLEAFRWVTL